MRRRIAVSRGPYAAILSWKQLDCLVALADGPKYTSDVTDVLEEMMESDMHGGNNPYYWSISAYVTLKALEKRELVSSQLTEDSVQIKWRLTNAGRQAIDLLT